MNWKWKISLKQILLISRPVFLPFLCVPFACTWFCPFYCLFYFCSGKGYVEIKSVFHFTWENRKFADIIIFSCKWISSAIETLLVPLTGISFKCEGFTILEKLRCQNWLFPHRQMQPLRHYMQRKAMRTDTRKTACNTVTFFC